MFHAWLDLPYDVQTNISQHMAIAERARLNTAMCRKNTRYENELAVIAFGIRKKIVQKTAIPSHMYSFLVKHFMDYAVQEMVKDLDINLMTISRIIIFSEWCKSPCCVSFVPSLDANPTREVVDMIGKDLVRYGTPQHFEQLYLKSPEFRSDYLDNIDIMFSALNYANIDLFVHLTFRKYSIPEVMRSLEHVYRPEIAEMLYDNLPAVKTLMQYGSPGKPTINAILQKAVTNLFIGTSRQLSQQ